MFTQTKGNAHVLCRQLHYLNMNESIFDVDQLCCPVSQCLLYRFIKDYDWRERFICHILYFIFKKINMKALRITSEMTEIVFSKALHWVWLHLSKCAMNQLTIKCTEFILFAVMCCDLVATLVAIHTVHVIWGWDIQYYLISTFILCWFIHVNILPKSV